ncbi:hypothetical protein AB1Y20_005644 [Prymnesium parvum]|uniref:Major facilitator superfamily (MFS) profile domain-containing protein n=1 Tax=Prymnesium parvum TaxID=97485 RepID=A0AB34J5B8_PRYPA
MSVATTTSSSSSSSKPSAGGTDATPPSPCDTRATPSRTSSAAAKPAVASAEKLPRLSGRDKCFICSMCASLLSTSSSYAIMCSFFPLHTAAIGLSAYSISAIFVMFDIGKLLASMVAGKMATRLGRRCVIVAGVLLVLAFGSAIGVVPSVAPHDLTLMTTLFLICRGFQGGGVGLAQFAIFAELSDTFPKHRGLVVGSATTMTALGYFVGPPVGGALYSLSGFRLPFLVTGAAVLVCAVPALWLFPSRGKRRRRGGEMLGAHVPKSDEAEVEAEAEAEAEAVEGSHPSWAGYARRLPVETWLLAATALFYFSKWAWWDIYFTSWIVSEFGFSVATASLYIALIAFVFSIMGPISGLLGDRLGDGRTALITGSMGVLTVVYLLMGPWQVGLLPLGARKVLLKLYLVADGAVCCLIEPQFIPHMLSLAESTSDERSEHLTNFVTSLGQTAMNAGGVIGPFLIVPFIAADATTGFRTALAVWAVPFGAIAAWSTLRLLAGWCVRGGAPRRAVPLASLPMQPSMEVDERAQGESAHGTEGFARNGSKESHQQCRPFEEL